MRTIATKTIHDTSSSLCKNAGTLYMWHWYNIDVELNKVKIKKKVTVEVNYLCSNHNEGGRKHHLGMWMDL